MSDWVTTEEAAKITGYSETTIRNMATRFKHMKFPKPEKRGKRLYWNKANLVKWMNNNPPEKRRKNGIERASSARIEHNLQRRSETNEIDSFNARCVAFIRGDYDAAWQRRAKA